jgi:heme exporter protein D
MLYVGKFLIALARNGAGFIETWSRAHGPTFTPDPRAARRFEDRNDFLNIGAAGAFVWNSADFKLIACTDEIRIGPKAKPVVQTAPIPPGVSPKRTRKNKGGANAGQPSLVD